MTKEILNWKLLLFRRQIIFSHIGFEQQEMTINTSTDFIEVFYEAGCFDNQGC